MAKLIFDLNSSVVMIVFTVDDQLDFPENNLVIN